MPLGWRVHRKIEQIIREEMDAIGGQEMLMPVLDAGGALGDDRAHRASPTSPSASRTRPYILSTTHEETVTFHAREIQSYQQLPQLWYHFSVEGARRAAPARRPPSRARVHHEGRVLVRRDEDERQAQLRGEPRGVQEDLRPLRPGDVRRPGGERDHGRQVQRRLPRAVRLRRERARPLRERRLRRRRRHRRGRAARADVPRDARRAGGGRDTGRHDVRGARRLPRHRPRRHVEGDAGDEAGRQRSCSRSCAATTG